MNVGTKLRTILAIATSVNTALMATDLTGFNSPTVDTIYKIVSIILNFIIVAIVAYFNNDYTETAAAYTGEMRAAKIKDTFEDIYDEDLEVDEEEVEEGIKEGDE